MTAQTAEDCRRGLEASTGPGQVADTSPRPHDGRGDAGLPDDGLRRKSPYISAVLLAALVCWHYPGVAALQAPSPPSAAFSYSLEAPAADRAALQGRFDERQIGILEALNRADAEHLIRLERLVAPHTWAEDRLAYSPFPDRYAWRAEEPKLLVVDQPSQAFAAYEHGRLLRWGPVSSGRREHPTPAGLFHLNWRSRGRHSTVNPDWFMPWYFNFHNERGLSLHEYALPGRPASHACIRLLERDAQWLFEWGKTWTLDDRGWNVLDPGTPLLVHGCYDYDAPPPWRSPGWWATGVQLPPSPHTGERPCSP